MFHFLTFDISWSKSFFENNVGEEFTLGSCEESDMTERLSLSRYNPWGHSRIGHDLDTKQQQQSFTNWYLLYFERSLNNIFYSAERFLY